MELKTIFAADLFANKVALVTGGGTGIGLRTAKELVVLGCKVILASRKVDIVQKAAEDVNKGWRAVIDTNLTGTWLISQSVFLKCFQPNRKGGMAHTGAARAGVENLTKTLAVEWAADGVRVNCVAPGVIDSSGLHRYPVPVQEVIRSAAHKFNYTYRLGTEEEVSASILFLLSPAANFITGYEPSPHDAMPAWADATFSSSPSASQGKSSQSTSASTLPSKL